MKSTRHNAVCLSIAAAAVLLFAGCAPQALKPGDITCKGKPDITEALAAIRLHNAAAKPVRAVGRAVFTYYGDKGKTGEDATDLVLRFVPPDRLYLRCNLLGQEIVRLGSNPEQFWFRIKPKEVSSYWHGLRKDLQNCRLNLSLDPYDFIEALGMIATDGEWTLDKSNNYDILTNRDAAGAITKRITMHCDRYLAQKIEYFDTRGNLTATLELNDYKSTTDAPVTPQLIDIKYYEDSTLTTTAKITLKNLRIFHPSKKQMQNNGLFAPPPTTGFKNIYELKQNCTFQLKQ